MQEKIGMRVSYQMEKLDLRPFFPAAPYLFVADMMKRIRTDDPVFGDRNF